MNDAVSDSPAELQPPGPPAPPAARPHPWRWWVAGIVTLLIVGSAVFALWYFYVGQKVWTDDRGILIADGQADLRQVLWTPPEALPAALNTAEQEYEPCLSPDGDELYFVRGLPGKGADLYVSFQIKGSRPPRSWDVLPR